jgi:hypothetical protein
MSDEYRNGDREHNPIDVYVSDYGQEVEIREEKHGRNQSL